jgi:hypothetical protein
LVAELGLEAPHYVDEMPALMVDAVPTAGYDIDAYSVRAPQACTPVTDGDTFDLGDHADGAASAGPQPWQHRTVRTP